MPIHSFELEVVPVDPEMYRALLDVAQAAIRLRRARKSFSVRKRLDAMNALDATVGRLILLPGGQAIFDATET